MIGRRFHSTRDRRRGFTLVEVLLTLALLVAITALAWPVLEQPIANQRLRKAADEITARWCGARVEAMDSGRTYVFRYTVDDGRFSTECYTPTATSDDPVSDDYFDPQSGGLGYTGAPRDPVHDALPEGVTFADSQTQQDTRAAAIQSASQSSSGLEAGYSDPILFYPDGTTTDAELLLQNEYGRYIQLSLRGLTGTVTVGEVYRGQEPIR